MPVRATPGSAGLDLYASRPTVIPPKGRAVVRTDLRVLVPVGCYGRLAPRSGLALTRFIDVGGE